MDCREKRTLFGPEPVGFENTAITGGFWKEKQELVRNVTLKAVYDRFRETGRFDALKMDWKEGMPYKPHIFWESDVTKWIEGAAYFLQQKRDAALEAQIDGLVELMEKTQDQNGYLNAYFTVVAPEERFTQRKAHELYCLGHLIEGAIAYANATGKDAMLKVAVRYADLADNVFRIEHSAAFDTPGHEEIELALIKLYRYTGERRYLELAAYFLNTRGRSRKDGEKDYYSEGAEYSQSHLPVRKQKTAEGHSVRALYLYSAMADLAMETGDAELEEACRTLFENITQKRMYIVGGAGSTYIGEAFTYDYDLPEYSAYNETCASIALALFCRRMWLHEPDAKYADCAERALYNTVLSGMSLSGDYFFYENPLSVMPARHAFRTSRVEKMREHLPLMQRVKVFDCSCCPPNLLRAVGSVADYMYSVAGDTLYAHLFMEAETNVRIAGKQIRISQKTAYPYDGRVRLILQADAHFTLALRIPGWCPGWGVSVNGTKVSFRLEKGYVYLDREWHDQDVVVLELDMPVQWTVANPHVVEACGRVSVSRGPVVYCAEGVDNGDRPLKAVSITRNSRAEVVWEKIGGTVMPCIYMEASSPLPFDALYRMDEPEEEKHRLKLIPYFAWANRGVTEMTTWFLERDGACSENSGRQIV